MDNEVNLQKLKDMVKAFCEARDWDQFHNPKDLAIGMSTEANELLDLFRFKSEKEIVEKFKNANFKNNVQHELADVTFFILRFAQMNNIDISKALEEKMKISAAKYPIETAKGSNKKYNE